MNCEFCGKWLEKEEDYYRNKIVLEFENKYKLICGCETCIKGLHHIIRENYIGRDRIKLELEKIEEMK